MEKLWNRVREQRRRRGWSQAQLAERSGLSRSAVSAVETGVVEPSTAAALSLAAAFGVSVEDLFGLGAAGGEAWSWAPRPGDGRYWRAEIGGRVLRYPVEWDAFGAVDHDGGVAAGSRSRRPIDPRRTLVVAGCDPSVGLLRPALAHRGIRLIAFMRSSGAALELLRTGRVLAAGLHLSEDTEGNAARVKADLGPGYRLVHVARWWEGLATRQDAAPSGGRALASGLRWVGREEGSGARGCMDALLEGRTVAPVEHEVGSHRAVAEVIRAGYADVGVCVRVVAEEAGLAFVPVRDEAYDLCFASANADDPRLVALVDAIRSVAFRAVIGRIPGYESRGTGELA